MHTFLKSWYEPFKEYGILEFGHYTPDQYFDIDGKLKTKFPPRSISVRIDPEHPTYKGKLIYDGRDTNLASPIHLNRLSAELQIFDHTTMAWYTS